MEQTISESAQQRVSPKESAPTQSAVAARGIEAKHPFRWTQRERTELPVHVQGTLPAWLRGKLVRTAPASFERGDFHTQHWFDAFALLYAFDFEQGVRFRQQLVASRARLDAERGQSHVATFGTDTQRSLFSRLIKPVPHITDNTNVNVVPWQGKWLAMTETPHQHVIDSSSLRSEGLAQYDDELPKGMSMIAHPHYDAARQALVNVGYTLGAKSEIIVYRQPKDGRTRVVEGRLRVDKMPYIHAFGLSENYAVVIDQPLTVTPWKMLFSNRSIASHMAWQPERGTRLWRLDRRSGEWARFETDAQFCFHIVNMFEQGNELVFDFLSFPDAAIVQQVSVAALLRGLPPLTPKLVRARLSPGQTRVQLETLSDTRFEFPQINYRGHHARPYQHVWGAELVAGADGWTSQLVKVRVSDGDTQRYREPSYTYGEPVFVPRPEGSSEDDGVLLAVGSHVTEERTRLAVLDARTLTPLATCDAELCVPMGFHGNFQLA